MLILILLAIYKTDFVIKIINKISSKLAHYVGRFIINFKRGITKYKDNKRELIYIILRMNLIG